MNFRLVALLVLAITPAAVLAGCNSSMTGSGEPTGGSTGQAQGSTGDTNSSTSNTPISGTKSLKPCSLLSASELSQNGLGSGKLEHHNRSCAWDNETANNDIGYSIEVDVQDSAGIDAINRQIYSVTDDPINGRQAKQAKEITGSACFVTLRVTNSSSVDVVADGGNGDVNLSCQYANQFAKLVEPKLPGGS